MERLFWLRTGLHSVMFAIMFGSSAGAAIPIVTTGSSADGIVSLATSEDHETATGIAVARAKPVPSPSPSASPTPIAGGLTFYVSPAGSDSNAGTLENPWRTIQHAASSLFPGQTAIVFDGVYDERVSITSSGNQVNPITLQAADGAVVRMLGFNLSGSYWVLRGFDITTQVNGANGYGVYVYGPATGDIIENNYIHELCQEGIYMESTVAQTYVHGNRIWRAEMAGVNVDGVYNLIEGNEVWDTQERPVNAGGIYSTCSTPGGADADGFRFFGQHNIFRSNYLHDINYGTPVNPDPHIDCFQTWGSRSMTVDDILIERNLCRWPSSNPNLQDEAAMIEGISGRVGTVTLQNNVFADMLQGINVGNKVAALRVLNNTWHHILQEAVIFTNRRTSADQIINNIFYDVGSGADSYICISGAGAVIASNDFFMPAGPVGTYCSTAPYISIDPLFANYGNATGEGADYHLLSDSTIRDIGTILNGNTSLNGVPLPRVANDYDGTPRPIGAGYSIGAFEE